MSTETKETYGSNLLDALHVLRRDDLRRRGPGRVPGCGGALCTHNMPRAPRAHLPGLQQPAATTGRHAYHAPRPYLRRVQDILRRRFTPYSPNPVRSVMTDGRAITPAAGGDHAPEVPANLSRDAGTGTTDALRSAPDQE